MTVVRLKGSIEVEVFGDEQAVQEAVAVAQEALHKAPQVIRTEMTGEVLSSQQRGVDHLRRLAARAEAGEIEIKSIVGGNFAGSEETKMLHIMYERKETT